MTGDIIVALVGMVSAIVVGLISAFATGEKATKKVSDKVDEVSDHVDGLGNRIERLERHDHEQYMAILRQTVINDDMPVLERAEAGRKYLELGGDGDVGDMCADLFARAEELKRERQQKK